MLEFYNKSFVLESVKLLKIHTKFLYEPDSVV